MESTATKVEDEAEKKATLQKRLELEGRAVSFLQAAIQSDNGGDYAKAVEQYEAALHSLVELVLLYSSETEDALKQGLRTKMTEVADRAEVLRSFLREQTAKKDDAQEKEPKGLRECEEVLQIEGVQCLHIHAGYVLPYIAARPFTHHHNNQPMNNKREQEEVGRGTLRILKVSITEKEMGAHQHLFHSLATESDAAVNGAKAVHLTFVALGDYQLPLIPGLPCLRITPLSFLLPMQQEGHFVAYIFPNNIPLVYVEVFERKMREICEVKHSYTDAGPAQPMNGGGAAQQQTQKQQQQPYSVEEEEEEEEGKEEEGEKKSPKQNKMVVVERTNVKIDQDNGESWQVTNEVIKFGSDAQGAIVPYRPFDATTTISERTASYLDYVASAIDGGSAYLSQRLEQGSEVFAQRLAETVQHAKDSGWLTPNEEEMKVNPLVKGTIYYGSRMSPIAVTASGAVVNGLVYAAEGLGRLVGRGVAMAAPKGGGGSGYAPVRSAVDVGGATVRGVVSVWEALENAGHTVLSASSGATVSIVQHKYGSEAATVMSQGFAMSGDIVQTVSNVRSLGVKKLAKKAAKKSGVSAARTVMTIRTDENGKPLAIEDVKTQTTPTIEFPMPDSPASLPAQPQPLMIEGQEADRPLLTIEEVDDASMGQVVEHNTEGQAPRALPSS